MRIEPRFAWTEGVIVNVFKLISFCFSATLLLDLEDLSDLCADRTYSRDFDLKTGSSNGSDFSSSVLFCT